MKKTSDNWLNDLRRERLQGSSRNPGAAALMSFFIMGMGQIYAGHIDRGIALMGCYFSGIFAAYSLYNNGLLYEALFPYLGAHLLVMCCYVASVVFILLWIYNIKDAYYLSLFSSFRDWFEVERILLPMLKEQSSGLLTGPTVNADLLEDNSDDYETAQTNTTATPATDSSFAAADEAAPTIASVAADAEEADVLEFRVDRKTQPKKLEKRREEEKSEAAHVVAGRDFEAVGSYGSSWRLYAGLIVIFVLIGIWFNNRQVDGVARPGGDSTTLFTVSADLGKKSDTGLTDITLPDSQLSDVAATSSDSTMFAAGVVAGSNQQTTIGSVQSPGAVGQGSASQGRPDTSVGESSAQVVENTSPQKPEEPPFMKGLELVRNGSVTEAAVLFEDDLKRSEPTEDSWKVVLNTFYRVDNKVAYEINLRRYLKKYSGDAAAWFNLGKLLYDRNELVQAAQAIAGGLKAEPDNVRGNFLLGSIYSDLRLHDDSATYLLRAVNLEPLNIDFNRQLARALVAAGKPKEAVKYYQRVNSLAPDDKEARQAIAASRPEMAMAFSADETDDNQVLVVMGKSESRLIERNREEAPIQQMGTVLYQGSESANAAIDEPETIVVESVPDAKPTPVPAVIAQPQPVKVPEPAIPQVKAPEIKTSEVKIPGTKAPEIKPPAAVESAVKPEIAAKTPPQAAPAKNNEIAVAASVKASGLSSLEAEPAKLEEKKDDFRDAIATAEDTRKKTSPKASRIEEFRQKGSYEFSRGNWEAALPHYLNILKEKKDAQTYDIVSLIFEKLSMNRDAFDSIEHAYRLGMRDSSTLAKLGRLAELNGDYKKGEYYLYHALQKIPHRVDLRIRYARCLEANGREPIALKELEKIVRGSGDSYAVRRRAELEMQRIRSGKP
ncbi:MAG TPA: hypothetical protein DCG57_05715 [Candidatus Riflebacteria bacterium]|nr:hypothetical protein [Candidatus Riflebacteria bacterium]